MKKLMGSLIVATLLMSSAFAAETMSKAFGESTFSPFAKVLVGYSTVSSSDVVVSDSDESYGLELGAKVTKFDEFGVEFMKYSNNDIQYMLNYRRLFNVDSYIQPFITGGLGYIDVDDLETSFTYRGGFGLRAIMTEHWHADATYTYAEAEFFGEKISTNNYSLGVAYSW